MPTNNNTATNVSVGKPAAGGAVYRADTTATAPTSADSSLGSTFKCTGYISDDGWTNTLNRESTDIKAWGGDTVLTTQTSKSEEIKLTFIEILNDEVLKTLHGDTNVSGALATGLSVQENSKEFPTKMWVIDTILTGGVKCRKVVPYGKVSEIGDIQYKDDTVIGAEVTISALPDTSGNTSYTYYKQPASGTSGQSGQS